ncbi:hypothetical protein NE237_023252 [Protea cynaroides]|uniref:Squalene cyclase C-terminal domain-containing protein n=1 Tax=Protea cynaroides TaxID=273540 RepID=A0A9Q0HBV1_9MAGN|nr:hypothetical protein NE237_023252 [Protea cynaroides]
MQLTKENGFVQEIPIVKIGADEEITNEVATQAKKRSIRFYSALQANDGHWPAENTGPLFFLPPLLREELYLQPYHEINWKKARHMCAKVLCMLACWVEDPNGEAFKYHLARIPNIIWVAEDGMKIQGSGSQQWDTGFSVQAMLASNLMDEIGPTLRKAHDYIKKSQVSDCTAEGLKVTLLLSLMPPEIVGKALEPHRLYDAVNIILYLQSEKGGLSAWEPARAASWLELLNPTDFFEDTFIEHEYVECTGSAIQDLVLFKKLYPGHREKDINKFTEKALPFVQQTQMPDGSWYGNWGVCFTYGAWFALGGLAAAGKTYNNCPAVRRGCQFLLSKQQESGCWGESYLSCSNKEYVPLEGGQSNLVQTAWAMMALLHAGQDFYFLVQSWKEDRKRTGSTNKGEKIDETMGTIKIKSGHNCQDLNTLCRKDCSGGGKGFIIVANAICHYGI